MLAWHSGSRPGGGTEGEKRKEKSKAERYLSLPGQVEPFWRTWSSSLKSKEWVVERGVEGGEEGEKPEAKGPGGLGIARLWLAPGRSNHISIVYRVVV